MTWTQELYKLKCQDQVAFQKLTLAAGRELIVWEGVRHGSRRPLRRMPQSSWWALVAACTLAPDVPDPVA